MNIYHVKRTDSYSYDDYSDFVCTAPSAEIAQNMQPSGYFGSWTLPKNVKVTHIGTAIDDTEVRIICKSFHAG